MKHKLILFVTGFFLFSSAFSQEIFMALLSQPPSIKVGEQGKVILEISNQEVDEVPVPADKLRPFISFPSCVRVDGANLPQGWSIVQNDGQTIRFGNTTDGPTFLPDAPRMIEILITGVSAVADPQVFVANLAYNGPYGANGYPDGMQGNNPQTSIMVTAATTPVAYTQDLKAEKAGSAVTLSWKTGVETNNKGFSVQRSADNGASFTTIGFVEAKGSNSSYTYSDAAAVSGINQYRLEQLDMDGKKSYSNVVSVNFDGVSGLSVYPNPATTQVTVKATEPVQVFDMSGKLVLTQQPMNGAAVLNVSRLAKGTYVVKSGKANAKFVKL